jgi:hypothetical protein
MLKWIVPSQNKTTRKYSNLQVQKYDVSASEDHETSRKGLADINLQQCNNLQQQ